MMLRPHLPCKERPDAELPVNINAETINQMGCPSLFHVTAMHA